MAYGNELVLRSGSSWFQELPAPKVCCSFPSLLGGYSGSSESVVELLPLLVPFDDREQAVRGLVGAYSAFALQCPENRNRKLSASSQTSKSPNQGRDCTSLWIGFLVRAFKSRLKNHGTPHDVR